MVRIIRDNTALFILVICFRILSFRTMRGQGYGADMGVIPRCLEYMLRSPMMSYSELCVSYLQIYCEIINDLLAPSNTQLSIRERSGGGGVFVEGLSRAHIGSLDDVTNLLDQGDTNRVVASTNMNAVSSRSHAALIVSIIPKGDCKENQSALTGADYQLRERSLVLVDLSGSERASASGGKYIRLEEAKAINLSLSSLGNCISALCENRNHIPYRDSKLTRLLQGSLGGGARTSIVVNIPSGNDQNGETMSALRFASRAAKVVVTAKIQRFVDYEALYKNAQKELDERDAIQRSLDLKLGRQEDRIEELESLVQSLRLEVKAANTQIEWRADKQASSSRLSEEGEVVGPTGVVRDPTAKTIQDIIVQHVQDMEQLKRQMDKKVDAYKLAASQTSQELSATQLDLQNEKQKHYETLKELRECRERLNESERAVHGRVNDLLGEIAEKRSQIEELQSDPLELQAQNEKLKETVQMLAERLEEAVEEMESMVSRDEVEKMEFMFSDTVTRLSTRVVQLENKYKNNEHSSNKKLDDCGGALDFDTMSDTSSKAPLIKPAAGGKSSARLQPGGKLRTASSQYQSAGNSNSVYAVGSKGTGLVHSASTESVLGGSSSTSKQGSVASFGVRNR